MDYKIKYEKALKRASKLRVQNPFDTVGQMVEHIFPDLKESEDERIRKAIIDYLKIHYEGSTIGYGVQVKEVIAWLEKQGEQKHFSDFKAKDWYVSKVDGKIHNMTYNPTDKTEPKFKIGDWILNGVCFPLQIASIRDGMYVFTEGDAISVSFVDEHLHLWTIQDAMDGDVLVGKDDRPFIFTGEFDVQDDNPTAYCGINSDDKFITGKGSHWTFKDGIKPATKEQRDLLFQKMKEAGYKWDSEKKELKKIKIKSKNLELKTLNADKVVEWLKNNGWCTVGGPKVKMAQINKFKNDFGL